MFFRKVALVGLILALLLAVLPFLLFEVFRVFYSTPIDPNEGFMVIHTSRLLAGQPLYAMPHQDALLPPPSEFIFTPVNYPPLSFVVVAALSSVTGSILFTGRLLSLLSFFVTALLIYGIIANCGSKKSAAFLGALVWVALMAQRGGHYVGMYDPQMLGHVVSLGSLYLYSKWTDELTTKKVSLLAFLCCLALFIKHSLIAIPITLAISLALTNRRAFITLAFFGVVVSTAMMVGAWLYGGGDFFLSFLEFLDRPASSERMHRMVHKVFVRDHLWVLFVPLVVFLIKRPPSRWWFIPIYFLLSLLLGAHLSRGVGVDINAWFDFFIAAAIVCGVLAVGSQNVQTVTRQEVGHHRPRFTRWNSWRHPIAIYGVLALCLLPFLYHVKAKLTSVLDYEGLSQRELSYQKEVSLLRSIPGPALYEERLLGFDAGKKFLVDISKASYRITAGRLPETVLLDPIRSKYFSAIILNHDVEKKLVERSKSTSEQQWTHNALAAVREEYRLLAPEQGQQHWFYVPRQ